MGSKFSVARRPVVCLVFPGPSPYKGQSKTANTHSADAPGLRRGWQSGKMLQALPRGRKPDSALAGFISDLDS